MCAAGTVCGWKYKCNSNGSCTLAADGIYGAQEDCLGAAGMCGWKFKCNSDGSCTLAADGMYGAQADCLGAAGKCGWKYGCNAATASCELMLNGTFGTLTECDSYQSPTLGECGGFSIPAQFTTTLPATLDTKYGTPQDLAKQNTWIPLGRPFIASRAYIRVTTGTTGTMYIASITPTGAVYANIVVRGFGNVTPGVMDPDSANSTIITGSGKWAVFMNTSAIIPALTATNGTGIASIGSTYQVYLRIYDATVYPIAYTSPSITVAQYRLNTFLPQLALNYGGPLLVTAAMSPGTYTTPATYLVPVTPPFTANYPYIQVRCDSTGAMHLPSITSTGIAAAGTDQVGAQYVVRGFGNVTANQTDPDSSNPVIIWGRQKLVSARNTIEYIPGLTNTDGNGRAVVGATYRVYIQLNDMTDEDIYVTWPSFTVAQSSTGNYVFDAASKRTLALTSSAGTDNVNLMFNTKFLNVDNNLLGTLFSSDGNYKLYSDSADLNKVKIVNTVTGAKIEIKPFTVAGLTNTMLVLSPTGTLTMYNDLWQIITSIATNGVAPYRLGLSNAGTSIPGALVLSDAATTILWSFPAGYTGVPP